MIKVALGLLFVVELIAEWLLHGAVLLVQALMLPPLWPHRLVRLVRARVRLLRWKRGGWRWSRYRLAGFRNAWARGDFDA